MRSRLLTARLALAALVLAAFAAAGAILAVRLGVMPYPSGLTLMTGACAIGVVALGLASVWLAGALRHNDGTAKRIGMIAFLGSIALLWIPAQNGLRELTTPGIDDVASDPDDPPPFVALAELRKPGMNSPAPDPGRTVHYKGETNTASYMLHTYYGQTSPMPITKPHGYLMKTPPQMFWHAFETAKKLGWQVVAYDEKQGMIEATDSSFWFGQTIDIAIRVRKAGMQGSRIDVRAQSEVGTRDFGANLDRVQSFFTAFKGGGF